MPVSPVENENRLLPLDGGWFDWPIIDDDNDNGLL